MINDEANNCYYFAVKNLSELNSLGWLHGKKEGIMNNNNNNNSNNNNNNDRNNTNGIGKGNNNDNNDYNL